MLATLLTVFGIGLVLFVHEAGHFLAARAAGVRVEVFSLGFGPRLFGWRRGDTDYRISLLPLGGYVRMAGEEQTRPPLPDELGAQSPGWRFLIFSGGILMNFLFALVVIPVLFAVGIPFEAPVAGMVTPGSPAWEAGVREGDRILRVDGEEIHAFRSFSAAVALGDGEALRVELAGPEGITREVELTPRFDDQLGFRRVGVSPSVWDPGLELGVQAGSVAAEAGLQDGDRLLAVDGLELTDTLLARLALERAVLGSGPLRLAVEREGRRIEAVLERPEAGEGDPPQIGILHLLNEVRGVRDERLSALQVGDRVLAAGGSTVRSLTELALAARDGAPLALRVARGEELLDLLRPIGLTPFGLLAGLWMDGGDAVEVAVRPGGPADGSGLQDGDRVLRANGREVPDLAALAEVVRATPEAPVALLVARRGVADPVQVSLTARPLPRPEFGFALAPHREVVRTDGPLEALSMGLREADAMVREIGGTLRGMFSGAVDSKNLGGIITIGTLTHSFASEGFGPLFFFLAMISIHLGVLNLLPIPALDGGHMLFVLVEKLRGSPLSLATQGWLNVIGLVAVLSLVLFVTMNDLERLFG